MQALSTDQIVGQVLGNYRIERFLGKGRLNAVYLGRNLASQRLDAFTMYLAPEHLSVEENTRFLTRFRKESATVIKLDHPYILPIYEYGEYANTPYLVTPYVDQGSLADLLKRHGRYDHTELVPILEQIASGIAYAHKRGCTHGTLRPSNVVVRGQDTLQVAGFGLMHMLQLNGIEKSDQPYAHLLTVAQTFLTSPEYVAPEVVQGHGLDARSDIYALGCIIFELLSGRPPFSGSNPLEVAKQHVTQALPSLRALCPEVPMALASVVNQALERDPVRRFQHVEDLIEAFTQASRGASPKTKTSQKGRYTEDEQDWIETVRKAERLQETPADGYRIGNANKWQLLPPIVTGQLPAVQSLPAQHTPSTSSRIAAKDANHLRIGRKDNRSTSRPERYTDQQTLPPIAPASGRNYQNKPAPPTMPPGSRDFQSSTVTPASPTLLPEVNSTFSASTSIQPSYPKEEFTYPVLPGSASGQLERVVAREDAAQSGNNTVNPGFDLAINSMPGMHENTSNLVQSYSWWSQPESQNANVNEVQLQSVRPQVQPQPQNLSSPMSPPPSREPLFLRNSDTVSWMSEPVVPLEVNRGFGTASKKSGKVSRRRAMAFLAAGGVAAVGTVFALNIKHFTGPANPVPTTNTQTNTTKTVARTTNTKTVAQTKQTTQTQQQKEPPKPTNTTQNTGTQGKMGTVIGSTKQPVNTAVVFANPATNTPALLVHLTNGTFASYDQACTHQGVLVNYDPITKMLKCPAHGAIFNPVNGAVVQGPAQLPLPKVNVQVQANGTITTTV